MKTPITPNSNFQDIARKESLEFNRKMAQLRHARERELAGVKEQYDLTIQDTQKDGEQRLYQAKLSGADLMQAEMAGQERRMNEYLSGLEEQRKVMQAQREQLSTSHEVALADLEINHREKMQERASSLQDFALDTDARADASVAQIREEADRTVRNSHYATGKALNEKYRYNETKLRDEDRRYALERNQLARNHSESIFKEKMEGEQNLANAKTRNLINLAQEKQIHADKLEAQKKHFEEIMQAHRKAYEQKLEAMMKLHDDNMKHVRQRHSSEIESLMRSQSNFMAGLENRSEDPFYNITALSPTLEDRPDHYQISMKVPAHEEQNVILSGHMRSLKITHARRASNEVALPDGSLNKTKRSESFTKEFPVAEIVDGTKISRHYDQGVLTFKILKA